MTLGELRDPATWPGSRLGLPKKGSGSVAPFSARAIAFAVDIVASALVAGLVVAGVHHPTPTDRQLAAYGVLLAEQVLLVALTGQTVGMRLLGLKVLRVADPSRPPGFLTAMVRAVPLLVTVGLAGLFTRDGRGLHDLAAGSAVIRD